LRLGDGDDEELEWRQTFALQIVRTCVADNKHHVLFIKDSLHNKDMREAAFSDLNELINHGGLPMRIFTPEVTDELIEKIGFISSTKETTKFEYYNRICETVSSNLHVMLCCSRNSFDAIVSEFPNFQRYCIVDHYGEWSNEDKFDIATAHLQRCTALNEDHETTKFEYYNRICERVSSNLHVMLCCSRNSFDAIVSEFPNFQRYCIVDHYGEWSNEDKFDIATAHLQRCTALNEDHVSTFLAFRVFNK
uniref:AAA_8 domain-containing protein n=1 Tax=Ascaris lumbricoides TaxID=6252 RepID=A0A0M3IW23_ASCLU